MLSYQAQDIDLPIIYLSYLVYAVALLVYGRWLRHYFGPRAQRLGWLLLALQLLLLTMHGWPIGPHRWWNHDAEYNIPVAFSTFQVLLGSLLALAVAILSPLRSRWLRGYWALLGLGLYVLAQDEFGVLHDRFPILEDMYMLGGALFALLTALYWRFGNAGMRPFLNLIIAGLVVSVIGAEVFDKIGLICRDFLNPFSMHCLRFHPLEETTEKLGAFYVVLAILGAAERSISPARWRRIGRPLALAFTLITLILLRHSYQLQNRLDLYLESKGNDLRFRYHTEFENDYALLGAYYRRGKEMESGSYYLINLYGEARERLDADFGYAIHIVDQASEAVYAAHEHWSRRAAQDWRRGRVFRDYQQLWVPEDVPAGRALWFVFSLWRENEAGEFIVLPIRESEDLQLSETQVALREFVIAAPAAPLPENALDYRFANGSALRGAEFPATARAGETLIIPMTWEATGDGGGEDWTQFLHFVHEETGALWNHDQPPLGARLPTRLWYGGLRDVEAWQFTLPADLPSGRYAVYTGLYRHSDLARLPVRAGGEDEGWLPDARVPLGVINIAG